MKSIRQIIQELDEEDMQNVNFQRIMNILDAEEMSEASMHNELENVL